MKELHVWSISLPLILAIVYFRLLFKEEAENELVHVWEGRPKLMEVHP